MKIIKLYLITVQKNASQKKLKFKIYKNYAKITNKKFYKFKLFWNLKIECCLVLIVCRVTNWYSFIFNLSFDDMASFLGAFWELFEIFLEYFVFKWNLSIQGAFEKAPQFF